MSRFYARPESVKGDKIYIDGPEAHHILDVMRLQKSDTVSVFDGTGTEYTGLIEETKRDRLTVKVVKIKKIPASNIPALSVIQAIPKGDRMDWIVEKSTELGMTTMMPVVTDRTIVRWNEEKRERHLKRWRKIAQSASKQCGRLDIPDIKDILKFERCIEKVGATEGLKLMAALNDEAADLKGLLKDLRYPRNITIAIGPEGDFTPREIDRAKEAGFKIVTLGPRVLRSDTAALWALAVLNYELSN